MTNKDLTVWDEKYKALEMQIKKYKKYNRIKPFYYSCKIRKMFKYLQLPKEVIQQS